MKNKISLKRWKKILLWTLLSPLIFILLYILLAIWYSNNKTMPAPVHCNNRESIYLASNGVHVDLILPIRSLDPQFVSDLAPTHPEAQYIAFGWGDKGFYLETPTWAEVKTSVVLNALLFNSPTCMHVSFYERVSPSYGKVSLCPEQLKELEAYIINSFKKGPESKVEVIANKSYGQHDRFFEAKGSYQCFRTCNVWVGQALKKAKVPTALWSPSPYGLLRYCENPENCPK